MTVVRDYYETLYHFRKAFRRALASTIAAELCALNIFTTLSPFEGKEIWPELQEHDPQSSHSQTFPLVRGLIGVLCFIKLI